MRRRPAALVLALVLITLSAGPLSAQEGGGGWPELKAQERKTLLLIAREALTAAREGRSSREAQVGARLKEAQPMAASIYVDGRLRARSWRLTGPQPLYLAARDLIHLALTEPKVGEGPLTPEELARAKVGLAALGRFVRAKDETEAPPRSAAVVLNGFKEGLALPGDVESGLAADLLSFACAGAGLRPQVWLLPSTAIFYAPAEEMKE